MCYSYSFIFGNKDFPKAFSPLQHSWLLQVVLNNKLQYKTYHIPNFNFWYLFDPFVIINWRSWSQTASTVYFVLSSCSFSWLPVRGDSEDSLMMWRMHFVLARNRKQKTAHTKTVRLFEYFINM